MPCAIAAWARKKALYLPLKVGSKGCGERQNYLLSYGNFILTDWSLVSKEVNEQISQKVNYIDLQ